MQQDIIFDLGAVVFRWEPLQLLQQVFADKSPTVEKTQAWAAEIFRGFTLDAEWGQFDKGLLDADQVAEQIAARTAFTSDELRRLINAVPGHLIAMEPTVQLIQSLKKRGHRLYYLSNMPAPFARHLLNANDFDDWFIDGIFSADVRQIKPEAGIFHTAAQRWKLDRPVFIDDSIRNIEAAASLGWRVVQFRSIEQVRTELSGLDLVDQ